MVAPTLTESELPDRLGGSPLLERGRSSSLAATSELLDKDQMVTKTMVIWECPTCQAECVPVTPESRCLCGHRLRDHAPPAESQALGPPCKSGRCPCKAFFFLVAEGSWMLRCKCKHKGVEHDPVTRKCAKAGCSECPAQGFLSPWVCNCNCPWASHLQKASLGLAPCVAGSCVLGGSRSGPGPPPPCARQKSSPTLTRRRW